MMGENEERTIALLNEHNELIKTIISRYEGGALKFIGDGVLSSYESATDAVRCGIDIQRALAKRNKTKAPIPAASSTSATLRSK